MSIRPPNRVPGMASLFRLAFLVFGLRAGLGRLSDNSFLWHFRTGQWIVDHGRVPRTDLFSFSVPGQKWVAQSWLAEAVYGGLDRLMGPFGIRLLGGAAGAVVAASVYGLALHFVRNRVRAALLTTAALGGSFTLWAPRPLFLGLVFFVALVWVVEVPEGRLGRRPMLSVPVLMWFWANVHGSFALGFAYLGLHFLGRWLEGERPWEGAQRVLLLAALVAFGVLLANPYGPALVTFPVELLGRGDVLKRVVEWRSPDFRTVTGLCFAAWLTVFVCCSALGRHRPSRRDVLVAVPFLLLALWAQRNIALAPVVGVPVLARSLAKEDGQERGEASAPAVVHLAIAALISLMGLTFLAAAALEPDFDLRQYPVKAMRDLERKDLLGRRLLTTDVWGGYVIAAWWPEQRVFFDDRYDMYPVALTEDYIRFKDLKPGWDRLLRDHDIDIVLWERDSSPADAMSRLPGWERLYRDKTAVVYVRS